MSQRRVLFSLVVVFGAIFLFPASGMAQRTCNSLSGLKLPNTTIVSAKSVPAGPFTIPASAFGPPHAVKVPAFCRVEGVIKPTADSDIKFEVWMPASGWNHKFDGVGNGGFAGSINYPDLAAGLRAGFATASTDTGHTGSAIDGRWALGHPEKIVDFGYRAIHLVNVVGKAIVRDFYGAAPRRAYFSSCSNGGRQALVEAQRFPGDYNGIIAGAPANFWTHLVAGGIWDSQATLENPASYIPASKLPAIRSAVLAACDAEDGVKDGILNDPTQCHFHPEKLLCKGADTDACLTAPQVTALRKMYAGPTDSKGRQIFPGHMPGGEVGPDSWQTWLTGPGPGKSLAYTFGTQFFSNMMFDNAAWDYRGLNFDTDIQFADRKFAHILNATDPNLTVFEAHGGKLILYHGWSDSAIAPLNTVNYYKSVVAAMGPGKTKEFLRLYMVPGMLHCGLGPGPSVFGAGPAANADPEHSMFSALERWVEHGVAPKEIIATKYANPTNPASGVEMTRPLCPYPEIAQYKGSGDMHKASSFVCAVERHRAK
jgi:hypothetical protein